MIEFLDTISSYWNKILEFTSVVWKHIVDSWTTMQNLSNIIPAGLVGVFLTAIILIIILRVINR